MADLSEEEIEQFTDVMVDKLAMGYGHWEGERDDRPARRDEIKQVIVDTELLVSGAVPLERWLEGDAKT